MMKSFALVFVGAAALSLLPASATAAPDSPTADEAALKGKEVFLKKDCHKCHPVSSASIEATDKKWKKIDADLTKLAKKNPEFTVNLADYLKGKAKRQKKAHVVPFKGTDEELQVLVDWLGLLRPKSR